jgi:Doublecortin
LEECTKYFQTKADIKHIFLLDGTPIFNLDEIPADHNYVAVSFRPFLRERRMLSLAVEDSHQRSIFGTGNSLQTSQHSQVSTTRGEVAKVAKSYLLHR